jgi:alginate O-acetyltransferase complex protein AlgI
MPLQSQRAPAPPKAPHRRFVELVRARPNLADAPGLYPGEPETCRRDVGQFLAILAHLALLVVVFRVYRLEGRAFQILGLATLAALPTHYLLPFRWKQPFLVAASIAALGAVFGAGVAAAVVALALGLVAVCRLPIAWPARVGLLAVAGLVMALTRAGLIRLGLPPLVWPVLASLCMFRLLIYMYELKHAKAPESLGDALAYVFLMPNCAFLHFPVVDYRTMRRGYFARDIHATQRAGLKMMVRGTTHLLLYRLVYHKLLIAPEEVYNAATLLAYLAANYLLYLRVSGQFHMACGMLHLFGYQLPETHHHYLLATGFTDYWRRINIYWKDFMVRLVFHPVVFRLRRWPQARALALATAVVFVVTWALHAYQSFWLRGHWGFSLPDVLFWGVLGVLVMVNVQRDARRGPARRTLEITAPRALAVRCAKTLGTFLVISLLWSLWSSPSLGDWLALLSRALP